MKVVKSRGKQFGDFSTNCFFQLAKLRKVNIKDQEFQQFCISIVEKTKLDELSVVAEFQGGFVNFKAIGELAYKLKAENK